MAIRNIVKEGDQVLHKKCRPVEKFDEKLAQLLDDMGDTLKKAGGVGLAAPQVGILRRVFIMMLEEDGEIIEAINPEIIKTSGQQRDVEGCLSVPNQWGYVTRPKTVVLRAFDRNGQEYEMKLKELGARCACHENDHLDGHLFLEKVEEFVKPEATEEK
ncbi:MAG: peptide deformylase [Oscillospiraceae bacterium]|nr:peptide deformylase [Oscillospiraceae bacterium]MBR5722987.1 peptide deformylase [Oscillospiraceae bacterium]